MLFERTNMYKFFRFFVFFFIAIYAQSCTNPDLVDDVSQNEDTTTNQISKDIESYITGKCIMLSFEKQDYSIPYSQLTVDTAYADADWITVSRHSTYVTVTVKENYTTEYRNCFAYYRLIGSEKYDTVIVSQGPKDTFFVNNKSNTDGFILDFRKHDVFFDVFSNVEYSIEIPDSVNEWIKLISPIKAKSIFKDSQFGVTVLANNGDYRETYITIRSKKTNEHQCIRIAQDGKHFTLDRAIAQNPDLSIFYQAIVSTGLKDTLEVYYDYTYPEIPYEWTEQALRDNYIGIHLNETAYEVGDNADRIAIPEEREFKFTVFCMPDSALANYNDGYTAKAGLDGIHDLNELRDYAKSIYDPEGTGPADETDRNNSLNKFISYHILPCWLSYDQFNTRQKEILQRHLYLKEHDLEDFFETLLPHSIMRISTPYPGGTWEKPLGIFINRRGTQETGIIAEGTRIAKDVQEYNLPGNLTNICVNGGYHYINKLLAYDDFTRNTALQCRMRIMCCTLSPDFINSRGRGRLNGDPTNAGVKNIDKMVMAYKEGFCTNFKWVDEQTRFYVRYRDRSFGTYNGDELTVRGSYDFAFKLPSVPADGTYEVRIWNHSLASFGWYYNDYRGIVQFYLHPYNLESDEHTFWRNWGWIPLGTPVDMRMGGNDSRIGMVPDNDNRYNAMTKSQKKEAIYINDKALHGRGYMKAPDSYTNSWSTDNQGDPIRVNSDIYRYIICNEYLRSDVDYWIRMRQVDVDYAEYAFNFIEIVPKSIYDGNEDMH